MVTANYSYDTRHRMTGLDRRLAKAVDADGAGPGTAVTTRFAYDGDHILLQFDETALAQRYLHGPVIDQILAAEDVTTLTTPGNLLWPLADHQGTVRDLVDSTGTVLNHLTYDAFGRVTAETNSAVDFLFAYTGRERDEETGLYYYRARYYDPAVGRFVSEDPIGFAAGDVNVSRYVGNGPIIHIDPTGLSDQLPDGTRVRKLTPREVLELGGEEGVRQLKDLPDNPDILLGDNGKLHTRPTRGEGPRTIRELDGMTIDDLEEIKKGRPKTKRGGTPRGTRRGPPRFSPAVLCDPIDVIFDILDLIRDRDAFMKKPGFLFPGMLIPPPLKPGEAISVIGDAIT